MTMLKTGLIQMGLKGDTGMSPEQIRDRMIEAHIPLIESAGRQGVQVLCFQEVFTQPYFCPRIRSGTAPPNVFRTDPPRS